ncbi:MAG: energy-coupling factor ABC transporter permease [Pirellulales bacterium]|nr:energy-coupling factor ABC transporter permease [Pirellulales bacterium]
MHLPSHQLDLTTSAASAVLAAAALAASAFPGWKRVLGTGDSPTRQNLAAGEGLVPPTPGLLAGGAGLVFALQMLNFPISTGASGHILGGLALAIAFGPRSAMWLMAAIITVQALLFGDGGLTTLGANILNMAIVGVWVGWGALRLSNAVLGNDSAQGKPEPLGHIARLAQLAGVAFAGWVSVMAAALSCAVQLAVANQVNWWLVATTLLPVHAWIGLGDALAAGMIYYAVAFSRGRGTKRVGVLPGANFTAAIYTAGLALVAVVLAPWASSLPDGLEWSLTKLNMEAIAENAGSLAARLENTLSPWQLADYELPFWPGMGWSSMLAGWLGLAMVSGVVWMGVIAQAAMSKARLAKLSPRR